MRVNRGANESNRVYRLRVLRAWLGHLITRQRNFERLAGNGASVRRARKALDDTEKQVAEAAWDVLPPPQQL